MVWFSVFFLFVLQLTVIVTDVNDNMPVCPEPEPLFQVETDVPVGYVIGRLVVSDSDIGENARITYSALRGGVLEEENLLAVNSLTGEISTIR